MFDMSSRLLCDPEYTCCRSCRTMRYRRGMIHHRLLYPRPFTDSTRDIARTILYLSVCLKTRRYCAQMVETLSRPVASLYLQHRWCIEFWRTNEFCGVSVAHIINWHYTINTSRQVMYVCDGSTKFTAQLAKFLDAQRIVAVATRFTNYKNLHTL